MPSNKRSIAPEEATHREADRVLNRLTAYDPNLAYRVQTGEREKIIETLKRDLRSLAYGLFADFGEGIWEKIEDGLGVVLGVPTAGAGAALVEGAGILVEQLLLGPANKRYHGNLARDHPNLSKGLGIYQILSEIPGVDSISTLVPEKTIAALGCVLGDIYKWARAPKTARPREAAYERNYVEQMYGKKGVQGYPREGDKHPIRPLVPGYSPA